MSKNIIDKVSEKIFDKDYSRRQFLQITGKGIAGVTVSATLLNLIGCEEQSLKNGQVFTWATPTGLLTVNRDKCVGCHRCEHNCNLVNDGKVMPYIARVNLRDRYFFGEEIEDDFYNAEGIQGNYRWEPMTCKQCNSPWCGNACPVDAIKADERTGARVVDKDVCIACGECVRACPWNIPRIDPEENYATKCINCGACVAGCVTGAITMTDWEDVANAMLKDSRG